MIPKPKKHKLAQSKNLEALQVSVSMKRNTVAGTVPIDVSKDTGKSPNKRTKTATVKTVDDYKNELETYLKQWKNTDLTTLIKNLFLIASLAARNLAGKIQLILTPPEKAAEFSYDVLLNFAKKQDGTGIRKVAKRKILKVVSERYPSFEPIKRKAFSDAIEWYAYVLNVAKWTRSQIEGTKVRPNFALDVYAFQQNLEACEQTIDGENFDHLLKEWQQLKNDPQSFQTIICKNVQSQMDRISNRLNQEKGMETYSAQEGEEEEDSPPTLFENLKFACCGFDEEETKAMKECIEICGGTLADECTEAVDFMLIPESTYRVGECIHRATQLVHVDWLYASIAEDKLADPNPYRIPRWTT